MRSFAENSFQKVKMTAFRHAHEARRTLLKPIASRISGKRLGNRSGIFWLCFDNKIMLMR
jgi:hypothetical protein